MHASMKRVRGVGSGIIYMHAGVIDAYNTLSCMRTIPAAGAHERDSRAPAHLLLPLSPFRLATPPIYQHLAIVSGLIKISYRPRVFVAGNAACLRLSVRGMGLMQGRCFLHIQCVKHALLCVPVHAYLCGHKSLGLVGILVEEDSSRTSRLSKLCRRRYANSRKVPHMHVSCPQVR